MEGGNSGLHLRAGSASDSMTPVGYELPPAASGFAYMQQLPPFPGHTEFIRLSGSTLAEDHFQTLITMYRAHAQRVMDSVNKFSFNEVLTNNLSFMLMDFLIFAAFRFQSYSVIFGKNSLPTLLVALVILQL